MSDDLDDVLAALGTEVFDDETRRRVDEILRRGQTVEPAARQRLVSAAFRGLRARAVVQAPFEVMAFERRLEATIDMEALVDAVGLSADEVRGIERGDAPLRSAEAKNVARWIRTLGLDDEVAIGSIVRSLAMIDGPRALAFAAQAEPGDLEPSDLEFVESVQAELVKIVQT